MFLPEEFVWVEPILVASVVVFFVDLIGNLIAFGSRITNALVTAILFGLIFGALTYYGYGSVEMTIDSVPALNAPADATPGTGTTN